MSTCAASLIFAPSAVSAQSFTVQNGDMVNNLTMANPGDQGIVSSGGKVLGVTDGLDAIDMANDNQRFRNNAGGLVSQSGSFSAAVFSDFLNADIQNTGTITASGTAGFGIVSIGDGARIHNGGVLETTGQAGNGVVSAGADAEISNSGVIRSSGQAATGVILDGANGMFANNGLVEASDPVSVAIFIGNDGDGVRVINTGRIISPLNATALAIGILPSADGVTVDFLAGTVIQGAMNFAGSNSKVNIGNGLNTALTFNFLDPNAFSTRGSPNARSGGLYAVVDSTGFAASDDMLSDLTGSIADAIDNQIANALQGRKAWIREFSGYRSASAHDQWTGFENLFGGMMVGVEADTRYASRGGLFFGTSRGVFETDSGSQKIDSADYFGGVYGNLKGDRFFVNLAVTGGSSHFDSKRRVANNLVLGGIERAATDYTGTFISPQIKIGTELAMTHVMLRPSLRGRYANIHLNGNSEQGSVADLSISSRNVSLADLRGELAFVSYPIAFHNGKLQYSVRVGLDASLRNNGKVNGELLGQPIAFGLGGQKTVIQGYAGFDTQYALSNGWLIQSETNLGVGSNRAVTFTGNLGLNIPL